MVEQVWEMLNWTNNFPYSGTFWSCSPCLYCESSRVSQHEILWIIVKYYVNHHKILWSISWIHLTLILLLDTQPQTLLNISWKQLSKKKKTNLGKIGVKIFSPHLTIWETWPSDVAGQTSGFLSVLLLCLALCVLGFCHRATSFMRPKVANSARERSSEHFLQ